VNARSRYAELKSNAEVASAILEIENLVNVALSALSLIREDGFASRDADLEPLIGGTYRVLEGASVMAGRAASLTAGTRQPEENINVSDCLNWLGRLTEPLWGAGSQLEIWTSTNALTVTCNRAALQSTLLDLLLSAREAVAGSGAVAIIASEMRHACRAPDVEFRIIHTGDGTMRGKSNILFTLPFASKNDAKGHPEFSSARRFAKEAGGSVQLDDRFGMGKCVRLRLPAAILPAGPKVHRACNS
tara:strand:+ start:53 stop:790 length:738 start_codon:yes stop_codon:yes gene_type:complete